MVGRMSLKYLIKVPLYLQTVFKYFLFVLGSPWSLSVLNNLP